MRALRRRGFEQVGDGRWVRGHDDMEIRLERSPPDWTASASYRDPRAGIVETSATHESPSAAAVAAIERAESYSHGGGDPNRLL
jgi:hypothetical protein